MNTVEWMQEVVNLAAARLASPVEQNWLMSRPIVLVNHGKDFGTLGRTFKAGRMEIYSATIHGPYELAHVLVHECGHAISEMPPVKQWAHGKEFIAKCREMGLSDPKALMIDIFGGDEEWLNTFCIPMEHAIRRLPKCDPPHWKNEHWINVR